MSNGDKAAPVAASRLQLSLALAIQLIVLSAGGYSMVARLDQRLAGVEETVQPIVPALIEMGRLQERLKNQQDMIRLLERDIKLNDSHIRDLEVAAGIQEQLDRRRN